MSDQKPTDSNGNNWLEANVEWGGEMRTYINGIDINNPPPYLLITEALPDLLKAIADKNLNINQVKEVIQMMIEQPYKKASEIVNERG